MENLEQYKAGLKAETVRRALKLGIGPAEAVGILRDLADELEAVVNLPEDVVNELASKALTMITASSPEELREKMAAAGLPAELADQIIGRVEKDKAQTDEVNELEKMWER